MEQAIVTKTSQAEATTDKFDVRSEFKVIKQFYNWYDSQGERRAGLPLTSLENLYTDLHVFESYARDISHKIDRLEKKWDEISPRKSKGVVRNYLKLAVKDISTAHGHLTTLLALSVVEEIHIKDAIKLITRHEKEDLKILNRAEKMIVDVRKKYDLAHHQFHDFDEDSDHPGFLFSIEKPQKHISKTKEQEKLNKKLNALIKEYQSFKSVIRQRRSSLHELMYCKELLTTMLGLRADIMKFQQQSHDLLKKASEVQINEKNELENGLKNLANYYRNHLSTEMQELLFLNQQLKSAMTA